MCTRGVHVCTISKMILNKQDFYVTKKMIINL